MRLQRLELIRVPGIDRPFMVEPAGAPGMVNVLTGANASGKSRVLHAMRGLLYPRAYTDHRWHLAGEFRDETGRALEVTNTGGTTTWSADGGHISAPELPDARFAPCYMLEFEDLAAVTSKAEGVLAERLEQELTGGYDLKAVREQFPAKASSAKTQVKRLQDARRERDRISQERVGLREDEERLTALRDELRSAEAAANTLGRVQDAQRYRDARRERLEIDATLKAMPPAMERLTGDDLDRLESIDEALQSAERSKAEASERQRPAAERRLQETGLAESEVRVEDLAAPRARVEEMRDAEHQLQQAREAVDSEAAALSDRVRDLGGDPSDPRCEITAETVRSAAKALGEWRDHQARIREAESARDRLPSDDAADPAGDALVRAGETLREWLAADDASGRTSRRWVDWLWLGTPLAIAAGWLAVEVHVGFIALLVVGAAGVAWRWWRLDPGQATARARERFDATGLEGPEAWRRDAVEARLDALDERRAKAALLAEQIGERHRIERSLATHHEAAATSAHELAQQAEGLGFDPRSLDEGFAAWLDALSQYRAQRARLSAQQRRLQSLEQTVVGARAAAVGFLSGQGAAPNEEAPSAATLRAALDRLKDRIDERNQALADIDAVDAEIARADAEIERQQHARQRFFSARELADGDEAALRARLDRREEWQRLRTEREQAVGRETAARDRLSGQEEGDELLALAEAGDDETLASKEADASAQKDRANELRDQIAAIEARVEQAGHDRRLQAAQASVQAAADALERTLDRALCEQAGAWLLQVVEADVEAVQRPPALDRAQRWFGAFTDHAFELELQAGDPPVFVARETATRQVRHLSDLSSGTRMQLLLAVRLGFAVHAEGDRGKLPLFLDQALATSDPERFAAAAKAVQQIAADGRQVFYLTPDPGEVARLKRALGDDSVHEIDIAVARGRAVAVHDLQGLLETEPAQLPSPAEIGDEAFLKQLTVPAVDPWAGPDAIHPFYLLRDQPALLHRILAGRLTSVGQVRTFLKRGAGDRALSDEDRRTLATRVRAVAAWVEAWREGRGVPIGRHVLGGDDSPVRSGKTTKAEEIAEQAEAVSGDPRALLSALRDGAVKQLHKKTIDALEQFLDERGYLPAGEALSFGERRQRVVEALAPDMDLSEAGTVADSLVEPIERGLGS